MFMRTFHRWILTALTITVVALPGTSAWARDDVVAPPEAMLIPTAEQEARVYLATMKTKERLLADYRKLLEVYYELKLKSDNPRVFENGAYYAGGTLPPTTEKPSEFASVHYAEFKAQLDRDPRLKGNLYVKKMQAYGTGQANDVFQRLGGYSMESFESLDRAVYMKLYREVANPIQSVAMLEANETYAQVSKKMGYANNGRAVSPERMREWLQAVDEKERELTPALLELDKKKTRKLAEPTKLKAASCASAYGKL